MRDLTEQPFEPGCAKGYRNPGFNAPLSKYGSMTNFRCSAQGYPPERRMAMLCRCQCRSVLCAKAKPNRHAAPTPSSLGVWARAIVVISDCDG